MEDLFLRDEMEFLVQPEHFQSIFGFIGILYSIGLVVALCDIFLNPNFGVYRLMTVGLTFCFVITIVNLNSSVEASNLGYLGNENRIWTNKNS